MLETGVPSDPQLTRQEVPPCWEDDHFSPQAGDAWGAYWEGLDDAPPLFRAQSIEYAQNLMAALKPGPQARVLDFGCGFGFVARLLAPQVGGLHVWDYSANVRRRARRNLAGIGNVRFLDLSAGTLPPDHPGFDLVLVNSVVQYLTPDELSVWLGHWRRMLAAGGQLVVSDIIPPNYSGLGDLLDILKLSARQGILLRACVQATRDIVGYWKKRRERPLTRFGHDELTQRAAGAELTVRFLPRNLTHFPRRTTAVFTEARSPAAPR